MRSIPAVSAVIVAALSGSAGAFAAPATAQLPALGGGPVIQVQAQGSSQPTPKQRRRARRPYRQRRPIPF
jgi:hypothetical protein